MSKGAVLRALVAERLTAAAEEVFSLIERTVREYEEELCRSTEENQRKQQLLDTVLSPRVNRAGVQFRMLSRSEESECISETARSPQSVTAEELHADELSDDPEPEEGGAPLSEPQGEVAVETDEQPEEQDDEPEPLFTSSPREMDAVADDEGEGSHAEENEEAAEEVSTESAKPKARKRKRKHRSGIKPASARRNNKHQCSVCGKVLKGPPNNLARHMVIHTGHKPYSCTVCKKMFTQQSYWKKHMKGHEKEKKEEEQKQVNTEQLETFSCSVCEMRFKRQVTLKKHMEVHDTAKESQEHRREVGVQHEAPKIKEQDEEVENQAGTGENGQDYTKATLIKSPSSMSVNAAPGDFGCNICKRTFTTRTRLKRHMIVHTGDKPFSCPVCHKYFSQKYNVRLHMAVHTDEKPYTCNICLKSYRRNDDLRTHMAAHTGHVPFTCVVCNAGFKQRNCLVSHMRLHTGDRPYRCSVCDKTFIQKSNLNRHMRSHTGEKPFRCPVCPQRFLQRCDIRKHMSVHT